jgi:hypothetical protein
VNPWRHNPLVAGAGLLMAVLLAVMALRLAGSLLMGAVLAVACVGVLNPVFAPTRYRVDAAGVAMRRGLAWERRAWSDLRRVATTASGVLVSPFEKPSFRDSFRGLFLAIPPSLPRHDPLLAELRERLARHGL